MFYEWVRIACKFVSDFEKAIYSVSAAKAFLPSSIYKGCLFHFGQIEGRKINNCQPANNRVFKLKLKI